MSRSISEPPPPPPPPTPSLKSAYFRCSLISAFPSLVLCALPRPYLADLAALGADLGDQHVHLRNEVRLPGVLQLLRVWVRVRVSGSESESGCMSLCVSGVPDSGRSAGRVWAGDGWAGHGKHMQNAREIGQSCDTAARADQERKRSGGIPCRESTAARRRCRSSRPKCRASSSRWPARSTKRRNGTSNADADAQ